MVPIELDKKDCNGNPILDHFSHYGNNFYSEFHTHIPVDCGILYEYFREDLIQEIKNKIPPDNYLERIIYNYMLNIDEPINIEKLIELLSGTDRISFYYTPIILFILEKRYDKYFNKQEQL